MRPPSRRKSLSPKNSQNSDYSTIQQAKSYQNHIPPENRFHPQHSVHYDPNLRPVEDRAGTPTVSKLK